MARTEGITITYKKATNEDISPIYELCKQLILDYENLETIDFSKITDWVKRKIEKTIEEYTVVYVDDRKAGYYHFYKNDDEQYEIDDLYIFPEFQNKGIGSEIVTKCCASVNEPVVLYVFIKNQRAVSLYERLGFEVVENIHGSRYIMKNDNRKYYAAYEERYKIAHEKGVSWSSDKNSPIVLEMIKNIISINNVSCLRLAVAKEEIQERY